MLGPIGYIVVGFKGNTFDGSIIDGRTHPDMVEAADEELQAIR